MGEGGPEPGCRGFLSQTGVCDGPEARNYMAVRGSKPEFLKFGEYRTPSFQLLELLTG